VEAVTPQPLAKSRWRKSRWFAAGAAATLVVVGVSGWLRATATDRGLVADCKDEIRAWEMPSGVTPEFHDTHVLTLEGRPVVVGVASGFAVGSTGDPPTESSSDTRLFSCRWSDAGEIQWSMSSL
jgi:hypothetical protein